MANKRTSVFKTYLKDDNIKVQANDGVKVNEKEINNIHGVVRIINNMAII